MSTTSASTVCIATDSPPQSPVQESADDTPQVYDTADASTDATTAEAADVTNDAENDAGNDADLELVMAQCGVSMEMACELLNQANGDIVEAIAYHLNPALAASEAHKEAQEWALVDADEGDTDEDVRQAREVQAKLAELRDITTAKNAMLDAQMRVRKATATVETGC